VRLYLLGRLQDRGPGPSDRNRCSYLLIFVDLTAHALSRHAAWPHTEPIIGYPRGNSLFIIVIGVRRRKP
jgi:hypothetical protein